MIAFRGVEGEGGCRHGAIAFHCTGAGSKWHEFKSESGDATSSKILGSADKVGARLPTSGARLPTYVARLPHFW